MGNSFERVVDLRLIVSVVACGIMSFSGVVVETAMNITFPSLMEEFGVGTATVQWVTTGYLLVLTAIMPASSVLKRRFRTKALFAGAMACFVAGTLVCALAPAFWALVAGRLIQGVGTGLALPLMFNIVIEQAPFDKMGLMMGIATLITAMAPAVGPSVGGALVGAFGWRSIFWVLMPFLAVAAVCGVATIRQVSSTERVHFGFVQFALLAVGFSCIVFAVNSSAEAGLASVRVLALLGVGVVLVACYAAVARRSEHPLVRVSIFRNAPFALSVVYVVLLQALVLGLGYLIPYYAQTVCSASELVAGCLLLPGCLVGIVLAPLGGRILDVFGARGPITFGGVVQLASIACFMAFAFDGRLWPLVLVYILIPISQGTSAANSVTNGLSYLPENLKTDGNAAFNTLQQLGGALGTAVTTAIVSSAQASMPGDLAAGTVAGAGDALWAMLGMSAAGLACVLLTFCLGKRSVKKAR